MKFKAVVFFFLTLSPSLFAEVHKDKVHAAANEYRRLGLAIMPSLKDGTLSLNDAEKNVDKMVIEAHTVMLQYASKYPEAKKLVNFLIGKTTDLKKLTFSDLEKNYHDAAALTQDKVGMNLKDEDNEKFLDPCHILIHPLMVAAAVREKNHKEGVAELNEGMEQMNTSEKELTK